MSRLAITLVAVVFAFACRTPVAPSEPAPHVVVIPSVAELQAMTPEQIDDTARSLVESAQASAAPLVFDLGGGGSGSEGLPGDVVRVRTFNGPLPVLTVFRDGEQVYQAAGGVEQADLTLIASVDVGRPVRPYSIEGEICYEGACVAASNNPLVVAPPSIQQPVIKSCALSGDGSTNDCRWKDRDFNADPTGERFPMWEGRPQHLGWFVGVGYTPLPRIPSLPGNESLAAVDVLWPGCVEYRLRMVSTDDTRDAPEVTWSPYSTVTTVGTCISPAPDRVPIAVPEADLGPMLASGIALLVVAALRREGRRG